MGSSRGTVLWVSRTLLANATYLDERMRFGRADVLVDGGRIASLSPPGSLGNGDASESLDCSDKLVIPGLINAHFHSRLTWAEASSGERPSASGATS